MKFYFVEVNPSSVPNLKSPQKANSSITFQVRALATGKSASLILASPDRLSLIPLPNHLLMPP